MKRLTLLLTIALMASLSAQAALYEFGAITTYTNDGYQSVVSQMSMEVVSSSEINATLIFSNEGNVACTVSKICFDGPETGFGLVDVAALGWTIVTPPPDLPAGDGFISDFCLDVTTPPPVKNGITPGNNLEVTLSYDSGFDILAALNSGDLRVGLHTTGIIGYRRPSCHAGGV